MAEVATRETALKEAEAVCLRRGAALTPLRRQVLELVLQAEAPIGAYALLAYTSLGVGMIGLVVPGLPTTEFVLLAAWAAAKSSPRLSA